MLKTQQAGIELHNEYGYGQNSAHNVQVEPEDTRL
jgi:hypothetical protein